MASVTFSTAGSYTWIVPGNLTAVTSVVCIGAGGSGAPGGSGKGGGGGAYVKTNSPAITPSSRIAVGVANIDLDEASIVQFLPSATVIASADPGDLGSATGGGGPPVVGDIQFVGGDGGTSTTSAGGGGGGAAGLLADGAGGGNAVTTTPGAVGTGTAPGGSGGAGGASGVVGAAGTFPGGGGGGGGAGRAGGAGATGLVIITFTLGTVPGPLAMRHLAHGRVGLRRRIR